jgi:hypothetical protein
MCSVFLKGVDRGLIVEGVEKGEWRAEEWKKGDRRVEEGRKKKEARVRTYAQALEI